ncbi:MAG TPA: hypothetical protein VKK31_10690 [Thermoanaerobaculia bacterium]|nr:hypothetical protein [Thermoanaerobaculia bacterium]
MRFSALFACISLLLVSGGAARADRIVSENGRELLGPDGRTLIDKQDGFSIVLPASDWKVHLHRWEGTALDSPFTLLIANPAGDSRVRVIGKIFPKEAFPLPMTLEMLRKLLESHPSPREKALRAQIVEAPGTKCLEREWESTAGDRVTHHLARVCDQDLRHKFTVETWLGIPVDQWPAEEKVLRELVESFRVLH